MSLRYRSCKSTENQAAAQINLQELIIDRHRDRQTNKKTSRQVKINKRLQNYTDCDN